MSTNKDDGLVPKPSSKDSRAGTSGVAAEKNTIPLKKRLLAGSGSGVNNHEVPNRNAADLVLKPSSKDSRAGTSGVAAEKVTIPLKKRLLAGSGSGVNNHEVPNPIPNAADDHPNAADLVLKPSSKDSRAGTSGVAAGTSGVASGTSGVAVDTIPSKKKPLARNESGSGVGVPNPNPAGDLATNDYQLNVRRSALYLCVEAFRGEASTMLEVRTQALISLMKRWNIPHVSLESSPHALVPNEQQSDGVNSLGVNVARRSSPSIITSEKDNFQADNSRQQRVRKQVQRFSTMEQFPFSCNICGQKFSAQSNLTTHKKGCFASKEKVDEEEHFAWSQKKKRSAGM